MSAHSAASGGPGVEEAEARGVNANSALGHATSSSLVSKSEQRPRTPPPVSVSTAMAPPSPSPQQPTSPLSAPVVVLAASKPPPSPTRLAHSQSVRAVKSESASNGHSESEPHRRATTGQMFNEVAPKDRIDIISDYLHDATSIRPLIGIVCGSGLGSLSKCLTNTETVKYEDIPQFPRSTVEGHAGELVFGWLDKYPVVCMRGRFHSYEGYEMRETALPIRVMYLLGIKYLIVTNAAGGLNPDFNVGDIMVMNDHLNLPGLSGKHPLVGPNDTRFGQRFTPLSNCYDNKLQALAYATAERLQLTHRVRRKGVYCFVSGPTYETPTECKLLRLVGGDAVGMSTVPEVIVAAHCGLKVLGLSLITNKVIYPGDEHMQAASHEEVLEATQLAQRDIETFVREMMLEIGQYHESH